MIEELKMPQMSKIPQNPKQPDRREYTIMLVPHQGQGIRTINLPIAMIKCGMGILGVIILLLGGMFFSYRQTAVVAETEKIELEKLRQVNMTQNQKIEDLARSTADLQADMNRLNVLDGEIRRMVNSDDATGVSRGGSGYNGVPSAGGQGGPSAKGDANQLDQLTRTLAELKETAKVRENSLKEMKAALIERKERLAYTPSIWPASGEVTSRFGWRSSPWGGGGGDWHPGIDIAGDYGSPVVAAADGVVVYSDWYSGYGKLVQIDHGNGVVSLYGHNSQLNVAAGQQVKKGQLIALMGSTGNSTGTHVHYEIRINGTAVNPAPFLQ